LGDLKLDSFWLWRYRFIVDSSARKESCPYAQMAKRYGAAENEKLIATLNETILKAREALELIEAKTDESEI
jgi:hypothetical protein